MRKAEVAVAEASMLTLQEEERRTLLSSFLLLQI